MLLVLTLKNVHGFKSGGFIFQEVRRSLSANYSWSPSTGFLKYLTL